MKQESQTYQEVYEEGTALLAEAGIEEAKLDARLLLEFVCGTDRNTLLVHGDRAVTEEEQERYEALIAARAAHTPLQHLTGEQEFMGLTFAVNENVLVPRQDTEILVEETLKNLQDGMRILDLCTGSGCILLSLLQYSNDCVGVGVDLSAQALAVARKNYERLRGTRPEMTAFFLEGDLFEALERRTAAEYDEADSMGERYDIIVSNPPYIETDVIGTLMPEVREHEPVMALDGGEDGLTFYRRIVQGAGDHLNRGGMLFFEIGCEQAAGVREIMEQAGFREIEVVKDFAGLDRVVYGIWLGQQGGSYV
ncbi:MAG: peptide chain release factor N(5)-glutamine methyltransferase [Lachnospiraceae bacterium]|nr:peptide chain release factor N(5)-glutamine methyltransferase [Lachnospiraceae bacterium]